MNWSDWILQYYHSLSKKWTTTKDVELLTPFIHDECQRVIEKFYKKYYDDSAPRQLWLGINPGRFGSGITGIGFSDPVHIQEVCSIENTWDKRKELSAEFVFKVIEAVGGPEVFYRKVYIDAISPLGYIKEGVNFNYYDDPAFLHYIQPSIENHLKQLNQRPILEPVLVIGKGKNEQHFRKLDHPFQKNISLPHPRWIMQYRRKDLDKWIDKYAQVFAQ